MVSTQSILLGLIGILLIASLSGANAVVAGQRTVLDAGFVTDQLAEEDVYAEAETEIQSQLQSQLNQSAGGNLPVSIDAAAVADEAINRSFIRNQTNRNVRAFYQYLHGNADTLQLAINLEPAKASIAESVGDEAASVDVAEVVGERLASGDTDLPIDTELLEQLTSGPDGYEEARTEFRNRVRERVIDQMVEQAFMDASNDELLALVIEDYDPTAYTESEKEQMVADREDEIRTAIREQITTERSDEIDSQVETRLNNYADSLESQDTETDGNATANVQAAGAELSRVVISGFVGDASYEAFNSDLEAAKERFGAAIEELFAERLDEALPATLDLTEQMDANAKQQFETARSAVSTLDLLAILLPLLSLGLIGLAYVPTRSVPRTGKVAGIALLIVGVIGVLAAIIAGDVVSNIIRQSAPNDAPLPIADIALGVVNDIFGTLMTQSLVLGLIGVIALAAVLAHRRGVFDDLLDRDSGEMASSRESSATDSATDDTTED
ncbi:MAG: hypothetical protein ABEH64_09380 [Salinirussus sp.]